MKTISRRAFGKLVAATAAAIVAVWRGSTTPAVADARAAGLDLLHFTRGGAARLTEDNIHMYDCGCCGQYHRSDFAGDCRNDEQRYGLADVLTNEERAELPEGAIVRAIEHETDWDEHGNVTESWEGSIEEWVSAEDYANAVKGGPRC